MTGMKYGALCRVNEAKATSEIEIKSNRADGRSSDDELRPIFLKQSIISGANGSCYFESGGTKVFCAVHGPRASAVTHSIDGVLHCEVRWAHFSGVAGMSSADRRGGDGVTDEERDLSRALIRILQAVTRVSAYPKCRIDVCAFVLEDDGGAFSGVISAASLALADAGIEMTDLTAGCSAAILNGKVILDPCAEERRHSSAEVLIAYLTNGAAISNLIVTGEVEVQHLRNAVNVCCTGASRVCALMRNCGEKQAKRNFKKLKAAKS